MDGVLRWYGRKQKAVSHEAKKTGMTPERYADMVENEGVDKNKNGSISQEEAFVFLENSNLRLEEKKVLWNAYNKSWKNNPYNSGQELAGKPTSRGGEKKGIHNSKSVKSGNTRKPKPKAKTESEKAFTRATTGMVDFKKAGVDIKKLPTAHKKAILKLMKKKLEEPKKRKEGS